MAAIAGARTMPVKPKQAKRAAELDHTAHRAGSGSAAVAPALMSVANVRDNHDMGTSTAAVAEPDYTAPKAGSGSAAAAGSGGGSMSSLVDCARRTHGCLMELLRLLPEASFADVIDAVKHAADVLDDEFDIVTMKKPPRDFRKLQRQVKYQKKRRREVVATLAAERGARFGRSIQAIWFLRAGISNPLEPPRRLSDVLCEFNVAESKEISHTYINRVRDAFCETLKMFNRATLAALAHATLMSIRDANSRPRHVIIDHIHDEALMRIRSFAPVQDADLCAPTKNLVRACSSKIQNNVVNVTMGQTTLEWFCELQPLQKKDSATLAIAIINIVREIFEHASGPLRSAVVKLRATHDVTGDGISTNEAALKRVRWHFRTKPCPWMDYFVVAWKCGSHQANLVVAVAICGFEHHKKNKLCCACVRLFKYLIPDYAEEFGRSLRRYVTDNLKLTVCPSPNDNCPFRQERARLQLLYGAQVFPSCIGEVLSGNFRELEVVSQTGDDRAEMCGKVYSMLFELLIVAQEKPIVTRFFLFAKCVFTLLLMRLLGVPVSVFTLDTKAPYPANQKRLDGFKEWYTAADTDKDLRRAALALQLTLHATSITAQKKGDVPMLV